MQYLNKTFRRVYNFLLAVRHRTGRTEQLVIAMGDDTRERLDNSARSIRDLDRRVSAMGDQQKARSDFLFQSQKALEQSFVETFGAVRQDNLEVSSQVSEALSEFSLRMSDTLDRHAEAVNARAIERGEMLFQSHKMLEDRLTKAIGNVQGLFKDNVETSVERLEMVFQTQKTFETSTVEALEALRESVNSLSGLQAAVQSLQESQNQQAARHSLQNERDDFRFETQKLFQSSLSEGVTRLEQQVMQSASVLADLKTAVAETEKLPVALANVEKTGQEIWEALQQKDNMRDFARLFSNKGRRLQRIPKLKDVFHDYMDFLKEGEPLELWGFDVSYLDRKSLWIQLNELICREEYFFSDDYDAPHRIIDGGANIGLSILFFKAFYPNASITAFEPNEDCFAVAQKNIEQNALEGVTLIKAALGTEDGEAEFYINATDSMGASLAPRHLTEELLNGKVTVAVAGLAGYLEEATAFLKLDIEGNEAEVLQAVGDKIRNVENIFCEYHFSENYKQRNKLRDIVDLLDDANYDFQIAKSLWFGEASEYRPVSYVGQDYSGVIYAKRRDGEGVR